MTGLAPDGGLYIPVDTPSVPDGWERWGYIDAVSWSLEAFGVDEPRSLVAEAAARFGHPDIAPVLEVGDRHVYELFWGPTLSFKDHALQVLGRLLAREMGDASPALAIGATSGDTGSAAIEGCRGQPNLRIIILYPDGMVSEFQRRQMTTVPDENVMAVAVRGTFDDCQAMVKQAFADHEGLVAVNSINWARIAAQVGYYLFLSARMGTEFDVVVPTGNFGNAYSCWLAKQMGVPIRRITLANNANHLLTDVVEGNGPATTPVTPTLAPAMDIAIPSNFERFVADPMIEFSAGWVTDSEILRTIASVYDQHDYLLDPHTATAWKVGEETRTDKPQVVVSTAHPAKFASAVESAIGSAATPPPGYESVMDRPERIVTIDADPSALNGLIR
jgi:threonine synthase